MWRLYEVDISDLCLAKRVPEVHVNLVQCALLLRVGLVVLPR